MKPPLKFALGSIVWFGPYVIQLTTGGRKRACWTLPAGAWRTPILPLALAVSIAVPAGTQRTAPLTPRRPVGSEYGTGPATASRCVVLPTRSCSLVLDALQRLIR